MNFEALIDVEFVFKRKQTAKISLTFDKDNVLHTEFLMGELIASRSNVLEVPFG